MVRYSAIATPETREVAHCRLPGLALRLGEGLLSPTSPEPTACWPKRQLLRVLSEGSCYDAIMRGDEIGVVTVAVTVKHLRGQC